MIILPTEKRFDWNNPPYILCLLIFLNVLVYFFYQSGDDDKVHHATEMFIKAQLVEKEWKPFADYLKAEGETEDAEYIEDAFKHGDKDTIALGILYDKEYTRKIRPHLKAIYGEKHYQALIKKRNAAFSMMASRSAERFGLIPDRLHIVNLFTSQFLHGDFMHLLGNMFFLVICGFAVEAAIGHWRFLLFYLLSGAAGGLLDASLKLDSLIPSIGASGSVSGVMAMYLWVFRLKNIEFFYWFYVFVGYVRLPALIILPLYIGQEIVNFIMEKNANIGFMCHAGGFMSASLMMAALWHWKPDMLDEEYIEEDHSINPYQQKLAEIYEAMENGQFSLALKRLKELMNEYQETFQLSLLQYQLMKMHRNTELDKVVRKVLGYTKLNEPQLAKQEKVFTECSDMHNSLSDDELLRTGMRFAALPGMESAENIFSILKSRQSRHDMMGVFARKLSVNFASLMNQQKSDYYSNLADAYLDGGQP